MLLSVSSRSSCRRLLFVSRASFSSVSSSVSSSASHVVSSIRRPPQPHFAAATEPISDVRPLLPLAFKRSFSVDIKQFPSITDPEVEAAFKDLMAANWDEIPEGVVYDVKAALSKPTEDKAGQEALANVFRAAEASEEFGGVLVSLRMTLDDKSGMTGQNVATLPTELEDALKAAYNRYTAYLDAFGHDETYLRKKVEMELGTKMVHLKMRCSGLGSEWGKITVLGTSGLSGSYLEQRA